MTWHSNNYASALNPWLSMGVFTDTPGENVSASHNLVPILEQSFGYADLGSQEPLSLNHRYNIASQTKTVTAMVVMQLVEKGDISLDDRVVRYIPELRKTSDRHAEITIRHLLTHTAGLHRDMPNNNYWEGTLSFPTQEELLASVGESPLVFSPGHKMKYTNIGYGLLGAVISNVTQRSYQQYTYDVIIEPLELHSMSFSASHLDYPLALGYGITPSASKPFHSFDANALAPAAGLWANISDTRRLFEVLLPISESAQKRIGLTSKSVSQMITPHVTVDNSGGVEYGLGVDIGYNDSHQVIGHGGGSQGYRSGTAVDIPHNLVVTSFANQINHDAFADSISIVGALRYILQNKSESELTAVDRQLLLRNEWGYKQMISLGNYLIALDPASRTPFAEDSAEILEPISNTIYKIIQTNGFNAEGETVDFSDIGSGIIIFAGRTMKIVG